MVGPFTYIFNAQDPAHMERYMHLLLCALTFVPAIGANIML